MNRVRDVPKTDITIENEQCIAQIIRYSSRMFYYNPHPGWLLCICTYAMVTERVETTRWLLLGFWAYRVTDQLRNGNRAFILFLFCWIKQLHVIFWEVRLSSLTRNITPRFKCEATIQETNPTHKNMLWVRAIHFCVVFKSPSMYVHFYSFGNHFPPQSLKYSAHGFCQLFRISVCVFVYLSCVCLLRYQFVYPTTCILTDSS